MHGPRSKRVRSDGSESRSVLQAWVRLTLRALMIISNAVQHRVQHQLRIPGPRGVLARQIVEMGELLETIQLDKVVNQLSQALQERSLREVESRSPTPSEWSRVTSARAPAQRGASSSRAAPMTPRSMPATPVEVPPSPGCRRPASSAEIPAEMNVNSETPQCHCNHDAAL